jgi:dihydroorotase
MLDLAERFSLDLHVSHVSTRAGLELVLGSKSAGMDVTCETTPTYLFWSDERKKSYARSAWLTMKPPIRAEEDRRRLLVGIEDGDIDILATDHAPHTHKDKENGAFGIPLEDHYTNFVGWLAQHGLSRRRIVDVCSVAPGVFMHRFTGDRFGRIEPGHVASFTVTERLPAMEFREKGGYLPIRTRCAWSPFDGVKLGNDYILHAHEVFVRGVRMKSTVNAR